MAGDDAAPWVRPHARGMRHADDHARSQRRETQLREDRKQIAALEKEKAENDQRLLAGIQSVAPALAAINIVAGTYGRNVAIATGERAAAIDRKLVELRRAKKKC